MLDMQRQVTDKVHETAASFRELLYQMKAPTNVLPIIGGQWGGTTTDFGAVFKTLLTSEIPRLVFSAYQPQLQAGLTGMGVSAGRAGQELGTFQTGQFDKALAAFQRYVAALVSIQDLSKDLAKSTEQLKTELTEGMRQTWTRAVEKTLEELGRLGEGLDQLTSADQVARAEQIADLARNQYQANLQYLQQIYSLQTSLNQSWKAMFLSFDEARAKQAGGTALGDFYQTQLSSLGEQLKGATSPEQVQQIMQLMQQYGTSYWQLYGNLASDFFREKGWGNIEQFLKDQQEIANTLLAKWADEVKAKNDALLAAVQAVTDALNTETISLDSLNGLLDEEVGMRSELVYILNQEVAGHSALVDALNGAIAALGGFTVGLGSPAGPANANALVKHLTRGGSVVEAVG